MNDEFERFARKIWDKTFPEDKKLLVDAWREDSNTAWLKFRVSFTQSGGSPVEAEWMWEALEPIFRKEAEK